MISTRFNELLDTDKGIKEFKHEGPVVPWVDKYRPPKLDDVVAQTEVIKMLKKVVETENLPHLLFYGPSGTGKTSSILAIAMELFGPRIFNDRVIELNASDERGINVVRNKIVTFAKMSVGPADPRYPSPPYKIIILDEADAMTTEAQAALRKTIENKSNVTRFCFICNYINQIIEPIASRCVKFRFKPISSDFMIEKLQKISLNENLSIEAEALGLMAKISGGDMRKAIMILQNLKYLDKNINVSDVCSISNKIPSDLLNLILKTCINSKKIDNVIKLGNNIVASGYSTYSLLIELIETVINSDNFSDKEKAKICFELASIEKDLIDGSDEYLQLLNILSCIRQRGA